jgi:hypothetical protein
MVVGSGWDDQGLVTIIDVMGCGVTGLRFSIYPLDSYSYSGRNQGADFPQHRPVRAHNLWPSLSVSTLVGLVLDHRKLGEAGLRQTGLILHSVGTHPSVATQTNGKSADSHAMATVLVGLYNPID